MNDLTDNFMKCLANIRGVVPHFLCLAFFFCACLLLFAALLLPSCCHCWVIPFAILAVECIAGNCLFDGPNNFD